MIIVLFPAGGFGSTIEYSLRQFSNELPKISATVLDNGSMHSYEKEFHTGIIEQFLKIKDTDYKIVTPTYPGHDYLSPAATLQGYKNNIDSMQKVVLIYFTNLEMAERNQLFSYYKCPTFLDDVMKDKHMTWNVNYNSYKDMQPFELREALSFFIDQQSSHLEISIDSNWLCITPDDTLYNFKNTILKIIEYCELTVDRSQNLDEFYNNWFKKQQYIIKEFEQIVNIMDSIKLGYTMTWDKLSIVGEAIIQSKLRRQGIEIACHNLNEFPTSIDNLKKVLIN
jgi:hypothetical protein